MYSIIHITTCNENKERTGGYHELYHASFLSKEHAVKFISDVLFLTSEYAEENYPLTAAYIEFNDKEIQKYVSENLPKLSEIEITCDFNPYL